MSKPRAPKTNQRQLSIVDFCDSLPNQQKTKATIIQFPEKQVSKSRKKAIKRVIDHAKSLNW